MGLRAVYMGGRLGSFERVRCNYGEHRGLGAFGWFKVRHIGGGLEMENLIFHFQVSIFALGASNLVVK